MHAVLSNSKSYTCICFPTIKNTMGVLPRIDFLILLMKEEGINRLELVTNEKCHELDVKNKPSKFGFY